MSARLLGVQPLPLSEELALVYGIDPSSVIACARRRRVRRARLSMSSEHLSEQIVEGIVAVIPDRFLRELVIGAGRNGARKPPFFRVLRRGVKRNRRSRPVPRARPARTGKGANERCWIPISSGRSKSDRSRRRRFVLKT